MQVIMNKEHYFTPVDLSLWDVCQPHINDEKLTEIVLLHIFGEGGSYAIFVTANDKVYAASTCTSLLKCYLEIDYNTPNQLVELTGFSNQNIKCFSSGLDFTIALTKNGRILSCGDNLSGQLGIGTTRLRAGACSVLIPKEESIVSIQCGNFYCLALSTSNKVYEWGCRDLDKCDADDDILTPRIMTFFQTKIICQISCSQYTYAALAQNGNMYIWKSDNVDSVATGVSAMGCSPSGGFIYICNGILCKNHQFIGEADDFVVHNDYVCFKKRKTFYLKKKDSESPKRVDVSNFQSAFANYSCPQFMRKSLNVETFNKKEKIIKERNFFVLFYNKKNLSDLTIKLTNGNVYVQKMNLMGLCGHFEQILSGPWAATNSTEMDMTTYNPVAYETFLRFVYSGILYDDELTGSDLIDLYNIAESYFENDLKEHVLKAFKECLTIENVCELYSLADKQMPLVEECINFACFDPLNAIVTEGYRKMEPELAKNFLLNCAIRNLQN